MRSSLSRRDLWPRTCPQRAQLWLRFGRFQFWSRGAGAGAEGHRAGGRSAVPDLTLFILHLDSRKPAEDDYRSHKKSSETEWSVDRLQHT